MLPLRALDDGRKYYLTKEDFDQYRIQRPAVGPFAWAGERFCFGVANAEGELYGFGQQRWRGRDLYFVQKTDRLDPTACGASIEQQYWSNPFSHRPGR